MTWGKVDKDVYLKTTESMNGDYSIVMPFLVKALLDRRKRFEKEAREGGEEQLFHKEPSARGYLRPRPGYRLYEQRDDLTRKLMDDVKNTPRYMAAREHSIPACVLAFINYVHFRDRILLGTQAAVLGRDQKRLLNRPLTLRRPCHNQADGRTAV